MRKTGFVPVRCTDTQPYVRVLDTEKNNLVSGTKEATYIMALKTLLNRDGGRYKLPGTFGRLLTTRIRKNTTVDKLDECVYCNSREFTY